MKEDKAPVVNYQVYNSSSLPEGWEWKKLRDVISTIESGGRPKGGARGITEGIPSIGGEHLLYSGFFDFTELRYIPNEYYAKMTRGIIRKYDVLVVKDGATTGKTSFVGEDFPFENAAVNEHVFILRPKEILFSKYLFYWFQSPFGQECVDDNFRGAAQGGITLGIIDNSKFPLAPLPEQERIVARLEELLSDLEAGVAALKRVRAGVKRYKASVLKAACEGRLVGRTPSARTGEGGLPEGWKWVTVKEIGNKDEQTVLTGPFGSNLGREDFTVNGTPVLTIGCLTEYGLNLEKAKYISEAKAKDLDKYRVQEGDLLFSRMATVGRAGLVTRQFDGLIFNYHLMRLRLDSEIIDRQFFLFYVRGSKTVTNYVKEVNHGATRDGINTEQLLGLPVALPPLEDQRNIVAEVEWRLEAVKEVEQAVDVGLKRAARLRQAVLRSAFEGRL